MTLKYVIKYLGHAKQKHRLISFGMERAQYISELWNVLTDENNYPTTEWMVLI